MALILRNIVNRPLTWTEGDSNFTYLLTNMSGSNVSITGSLGINGDTTFNAGIKIPTGASSSKVLTSDSIGNATWQANGNIGGSGTTNFVPLFTGATTLGDSNISQTGGIVSISSSTTVTGSFTASGSSHTLKGPTAITGNLTTTGSITNNINNTHRLKAVSSLNSLNTQISGSTTYFSHNSYYSGSGMYFGDFDNINGVSINMTNGSYGFYRIPGSPLDTPVAGIMMAEIHPDGSTFKTKLTVTGSFTASGSSHILKGPTTIDSGVGTTVISGSLIDFVGLNISPAELSFTGTYLQISVGGQGYYLPLYSPF